MNKKILIWSIIAVAIIVLSSFPSVVGKVSSDDELVEITTEVFSVDGIKPHTVKLNNQELRELQNLIDDIENKLYIVDNKDEGIEVYNWAVEELNKYGVLGDINVEQAKKLVSGTYHQPISPHYNQYYNDISNIGLRDWNLLCLVFGEAAWYAPWTRLLIVSIILVVVGLSLALMIPYSERPFHLIDYMFALGMLLADFEGKRTKYFLNLLHIGFPHPQIDYGTRGWIKSIGLLGTREKSGLIIGDIFGYSGIRILGVGDYGTFFLGTALASHIENAEY